MDERPAWCTCHEDGKCDYFCRCEPHHPREVELSVIPTRFYECQVCGALLDESYAKHWETSYNKHLEWHERHGDL